MDGKSMNFYLSACCNYFFWFYTSVHCRTGSLEIQDTLDKKADEVHCRTGSLETR
jgi:hypothetical protein